MTHSPENVHPTSSQVSRTTCATFVVHWMSLYRKEVDALDPDFGTRNVRFIELRSNVNNNFGEG